MLASYPSAWLLLTLPFLSIYVIRGVPALLRLASRRNTALRAIGAAGLVAMLLALAGFVPPALGFPMMVVGGGLSGFVVFTRPPKGGSDGDGWWRWRPPPDEPPPPDGDGLLDWEQFDRLRGGWEREPAIKA